MITRHWVLSVFLWIAVCYIECRPNYENLYPVYKDSKQLDGERDVSTTQEPSTVTSYTTVEEVTSSKSSIEDLATVARSSLGNPHLVVTGTYENEEVRGQMVDADIRTPPKLKEILKEKESEKKEKVTEVVVDKIEANGKFDIEKTEINSSEGKAAHIDNGVKGIAVPVIMDDLEFENKANKKMEKVPDLVKPSKEEKKKNKPGKDDGTTTPSSGLSTWILLSDNRDVTTPANKKSNKTVTKDDKKTTTTKKPMKTSTTANPQKVRNSSEPYKPTNTTKKAVPKPLLTKVPARTTEASVTETPMSALEAMVKQKKTQATTTVKPKVTTKKPNKENKEAATTKDKVEIILSDGKKVVTLPPMLPLTTDSSVEVENTTAGETQTESGTKKNTTNKKRKKNKNRRKKPENGTELELKKTPKQPVGTQLYNYLSREIMPTVGLGLVGVLVTAGLAGLLGYNPFIGGAVPVRRTYVTKHGYSPNYYQNEYDNDGGQSEEVLFRQVLSGMPEESKYGLQGTDVGYPETQLYNSQEESYNKDKNEYQNEYDNYYKDEQGGTSFVYPEKTQDNDVYGTAYGSNPGYGVGQVEKIDNEKTTIEKQPEALYRVADEDYNNDKNWHRIGSVASESYKRQLPSVEPGPRSMKIRRRRSVIQRIARKTDKGGDVSSDKNELENDIFVPDVVSRDDKLDEIMSTTGRNQYSTTLEPLEALEEVQAHVMELTDGPHKVVTTVEMVENVETSTNENVKDVTASTTDSYITSNSVSTDGDNLYPTEIIDVQQPQPVFSILELLKRLTTLKLRLGLSFLRSTTDAFSKYLDSIQKKVDDSLDQTSDDKSNYFYNYRRKNWSRNLFKRKANKK